MRCLRDLEAGTARFEKQTGETCYASMLKKEMGEIDWSRPAAEIERLIRGLSPWPSAYTYLKGKTMKIWSAEVLPDSGSAENGEITEAGKGGFLVKTGDGILSVKELQLEGKKRMEADAFLRGYPLERGIILGKKE